MGGLRLVSISAVLALFALLFHAFGPTMTSAIAAPVCQATCTSCCNAGPPRCDEGFSLYGNTCLPTCPPGTARYPGMPGLCLPPAEKGCPDGFEPVPFPECPANYHRDIRNPGTCEPDIGANEVCDAGFKYDSSSARCDTDCPRGTFKDDNGLCRNAFERQCKDGWGRDPDTGACTPPGDWPAGYKFTCLALCPQGTFRSLEEPLRCLPPQTSCREGWTLDNGRCLPDCGADQKRDAYGWCRPSEACPEGSWTDASGQCSQQACPQGYERIGRACLPPCNANETRDPKDPQRCVPDRQPDCTEGQRLNPKTGKCEGAVTPRCDQGETLNSRTGRCERQTGSKPTCADGSTPDKNGRCRKVVEQAPTCLDGSRPDKNGRCRPIVEDEPVCADGSRPDRNGRCRPIFDQPVEPACDQGFIMDRNGRCVPIRAEQPRGCGEGMIYSVRRSGCVPAGDSGQIIVPDQPLKPGRILIPDLVKPQAFQPQGDTLQLDPNLRQQDGGRKWRTNCPEGMVFSERQGSCVQTQ